MIWCPGLWCARRVDCPPCGRAELCGAGPPATALARRLLWCDLGLCVLLRQTWEVCSEALELIDLPLRLPSKPRVKLAGTRSSSLTPGSAHLPGAPDTCGRSRGCARGWAGGSPSRQSPAGGAEQAGGAGWAAPPCLAASPALLLEAFSCNKHSQVQNKHYH